MVPAIFWRDHRRDVTVPNNVILENPPSFKNEIQAHKPDQGVWPRLSQCDHCIERLKKGIGSILLCRPGVLRFMIGKELQVFFDRQRNTVFLPV